MAFSFTQQIFLFYSRASEDVEGNERDANHSLSVVDENLEDSDPYIFNCNRSDIIVVPAEDASNPKDQKASRCPQENKKSNSKKRSRKLTSKSRADNSSNSQDQSSSATDDDGDRQVLERKFTSNKEKSNTPTGNKPSLDHKLSGLNNSVESSKKGQQKRNSKRSPSSGTGAEKGGFNEATLKSKSLKRSTSRKKEREEDKQETAETAAEVGLQEEPELEFNRDVGKTKEKAKPKKNKISSDDEFSADDGNKQEDISEKKADQKESDDIFCEESPGDEAKMKAKEKVKDSLAHKKPEDKPKKKLSRNRKSKTDYDGSPVKIIDETANGQFEPENATENPQPKTKTSVGGIPSTSDTSLKKERESAIIEDKDEPLGDMSFLINVNSQIAVFVADASQDECELEPMTARERNDVYKVTQLYKLRARIGTKAENNLTTVRLSKQADTKMPKPGRVDRLLSELSIAASKEAFKESPKNQAKRKHAATCDGDKQTDGDDPDQEEPPKKKLLKKSRNSKV